jgi:hypothetical protein
MNIGLDAASLNLIAQDMIDLLNGPDAVDIVMSSETGTRDTRYQTGAWVAGTKTVTTLNFRGMVTLSTAYRVESGRVKDPLLKRKFGELPDADVAILMASSINLKGLVNVVFSIAGLGDFHLLEKPGQGVDQYAIMVPSGMPMVQYVFVKAAK